MRDQQHQPDGQRVWEGEGKVDWELGRSEEEDLAAEAEGSLRVDNTPERLLGDENKCNDLCEGARETGENHDVDLQEYVLGITEAVCCFVDHRQEQRLLQQR
ncbi:hypothetical protein NUW58_g5988 [Xylaria curta]|uniref:Uncharacterized protein n=1 Tax=Xylaria curta TaxID=42375 RepID=A0ACC1P202_9PEZI|nr:hypothetical protein NUW58_g5988 [Xylaria curta]